MPESSGVCGETTNVVGGATTWPPRFDAYEEAEEDVAKKSSKTIPALALGAGALALIIALVLAFIPFGADGTAEPTEAYRAQNNLDEVAFSLGSSPAASYTGSITFETEAGGDPLTIDFEDLIVTASNNAEGVITVDGQDAQYRAMGPSQYASAPAGFWANLLSEEQRENLDLDPTENTWSSTRYTSLPSLNSLLSPRLLAGRIGNSERTDPPELGAELPSKRGTPDARFLPTTDPPITQVADGEVQASDWTITFDPETKDVQNLNGSYTRFDGTYSFEITVQLLSADEVEGVFSNARSIASELTAVPAPGLRAEGITRLRPNDNCTDVRCMFEYDVSGRNTTALPGDNGRINYGVTIEFFRDAGRNQPVSTPCRDLAVGVPFGQIGVARCDARNVPADVSRVYSWPTYQYLAIVETPEDFILESIDNHEATTTIDATMVRTGHKSDEAARYNDYITSLPSSYAISYGGYLFDGTAPGNVLLVTFAPGYEEHISGGEFNPDWEGLEVLSEQMRQQVEAADGTQIIYWTAEQRTRTALQFLVEDNGFGEDQIDVLQEDAVGD